MVFEWVEIEIWLGMASRSEWMKVIFINWSGYMEWIIGGRSHSGIVGRRYRESIGASELRRMRSIGTDIVLVCELAVAIRWRSKFRIHERIRSETTNILNESFTFGRRQMWNCLWLTVYLRRSVSITIVDRLEFSETEMFIWVRWSDQTKKGESLRRTIGSVETYYLISRVLWMLTAYCTCYGMAFRSFVTVLNFTCWRESFFERMAIDVND
jgi:hypothetical protein